MILSRNACIACATASLVLTLAWCQPVTTQRATAPASSSASRATATSGISSLQIPAEGAWDFLDDSKAVGLKLRWKEHTFVMTIRPATKDANDRFAQAGISGMGSGESVRLISGEFAVDGTQVLLSATSGLFEYSGGGSRMTFMLGENGAALTNTKGLMLRRVGTPATNVAAH